MGKRQGQYSSESPTQRSHEEQSFRRASQYIQSIKGFARTHPDSERQRFAYSVVAAVIADYWYALQLDRESVWDLSPHPHIEDSVELDQHLQKLSVELSRVLIDLESTSAAYCIGELYTALMPAELRSQYGMYYTPPALSSRLLYLATQAGTNWASAHVLDPACGGGAFLTPVALQIIAAQGNATPSTIIDHLTEHLHGFELDPFGGWVSQVLLEAALFDLCRMAGRRLPQVVTICDSLQQDVPLDRYDLIIGNPPYGRLRLSDELRAKYKRSLHGHANIYGLFMDFAARHVRPGGTIGYITPTGFLGGEYFKALRSVMHREAPPVSVDLVLDRKGVFSDVLQETLLATYRRGASPAEVEVHILAMVDEQTVLVSAAGSFSLPEQPTNPWLLPRSKEQATLVAQLRKMPHRLRDYGYEVSTGPLVWNRHKDQLHDQHGPNRYPIVWAEAVTSSGEFIYRTDKRNHKPFLELRAGDEWLVVRQPCVLVQRTTAKEQKRRLIAAELPRTFVDRHRLVAIENHLNMVRSCESRPCVPMNTITALLNSEAVDAAFRCINGSVAVSAYELEALPLPAPEDLVQLSKLLAANAPNSVIQDEIWALYGESESHVYARPAAD